MTNGEKRIASSLVLCSAGLEKYLSKWAEIDLDVLELEQQARDAGKQRT